MPMIIIEYKIRATIKQMQIDDYICDKIIEHYHMWVPKEYNLARKKYPQLISVRKYLKYSKSVTTSRRNLVENTLIPYMYSMNKKILSNLSYFSRFKSPNRTIFEDFALHHIPEIEWDQLHALNGFNGFFDYLLEFNDLSFFDDLQDDLETAGTTFKGIFIHDVIVFELARRQMGLRNYAMLDKIKSFLQFNPFYGVLNNPLFFPSAADISYCMRRIPPEKLFEYFLQLVKEAISLGIIQPRILIGDGQFIRSNSNNNFKDETAKKAKKYNDPDAGYCRHNGVKKGVGYDPWCLYAYMGSDRVLPVYFKMYAGNRNDNPAFRETLNEFLKLQIGTWDMVIADSGAYSKESLEYSLKLGIFPLIRARKNLDTHPTKELKKGFWFNTEYFPTGWSDEDVLKAYAIRPMVEKALVQNNTFYNASRMNTRGMDNAIRHRTLYYILDLLRAITAYKVGRPDLGNKLGAFSLTRAAAMAQMWFEAAIRSGIMPLDLVIKQLRQNQKNDRLFKKLRESIGN